MTLLILYQVLSRKCELWIQHIHFFIWKVWTHLLINLQNRRRWWIWELIKAGIFLQGLIISRNLDNSRVCLWFIQRLIYYLFKFQFDIFFFSQMCFWIRYQRIVEYLRCCILFILLPSILRPWIAIFRFRYQLTQFRNSNDTFLPLWSIICHFVDFIQNKVLA